MTKQGDAVYAQLSEGKELFHDFLRQLQRGSRELYTDWAIPALNNVVDTTSVRAMDNQSKLPRLPSCTPLRSGIYYHVRKSDLFVSILTVSNREDGSIAKTIQNLIYFGEDRGIKEVPLLIVYNTEHKTWDAHKSVLELDEDVWEAMNNLCHMNLKYIKWYNYLENKNPELIRVPSVFNNEIRRRRRKRIPRYSFRYLDVYPGPRVSTGSRGEKRIDKSGTSLHSVCGHLRQHAPGKYCFVKPHMRGDIQFGFADKHRRIKK